MNKKLYGAILVLLSAIGFGMMGIFAKYAYAAGVSVGNLLFFRFLLAAVLFWSLVGSIRIQWRVPKSKIPVLIFMGTFGYAWMAILLFYSYKLLPVSLASIILYLYPTLVAFLTKILYKTTISKNQIISIILSFSGLYVMLGADFGKINLVGIVCALGCAIIYTIYIVLTEKIQENIGNLVSSAYITSFAALTLLIYTTLNDELQITLNPTGWLAIVLISFFSTFISILCFAIGIKLIGSSNASILSLFEPTVTVTLGIFILQETLNSLQIIGMIVVLLSLVLTQVK